MGRNACFARLHSLALAGLASALCVAASGCQVDIGGQTLPSPWYMTDDVQYFPAGPEFKLSREAAAQKQASIREKQRLGAPGVVGPPPAAVVAPQGVNVPGPGIVPQVPGPAAAPPGQVPVPIAPVPPGEAVEPAPEPAAPPGEAPPAEPEENPFN